MGSIDAFMPPYADTLVTVIFIKAAQRVVFQVANVGLLGRIPAVGETAQAVSARAVPPVTLNGIVQRIETGFFADSVLGITIEVHLA